MEPIDPMLEFREKIALGLEKAHAKMLEFKKRHNSPVVVSRNGKVVALPAEQVKPAKAADALAEARKSSSQD